MSLDDNIPNWWEFLLLSLVAFRIWRILAEDKILLPLRKRVLRLGDWEKEGDPVPDNYRGKLGEFLLCPWCLGFWCCVVIWGTWLVFPVGVLFFATVFAMSTMVGLTRQNFDPPEE